MTAVPARRRLVGGMLRSYREAWGFELDDVADMLGCDKSKVGRIETGHRGIRRRELRDLLTEYGCPQDAQDALAAIADPRGPAG